MEALFSTAALLNCSYVVTLRERCRKVEDNADRTTAVWACVGSHGSRRLGRLDQAVSEGK